MQSAMEIVAEHAKVKTLELEQKVRATPLVGDLEFYLVFIQVALSLIDMWLEGERVATFLYSIALPANVFIALVNDAANSVLHITQTRSYILADTLLTLHTLYPHYGVDDELSEDMDRALRAAYICLRSLTSQDVSGEQLQISMQVRDHLKELAGHAAAITVQDAVNAITA